MFKEGFTMIELIFVVVVIFIVAAIAIPRMADKREQNTTFEQEKAKAISKHSNNPTQTYTKENW